MRSSSWISAASFATALSFVAAPAAFGYGAFAIGGSTADAQYGFAAGYSWNQPTQAMAETKAMEQCRSYPSEAPDKTNAKCAIVANYRHAWLVIAMDPDAGQTGFGYSINIDRSTAESNAMGQCRASSPDHRKSHCSIAGAKYDETP
jgi:hypothetical protein